MSYKKDEIWLVILQCKSKEKGYLKPIWEHRVYAHDAMEAVSKAIHFAQINPKELILIEAKDRPLFVIDKYPLIGEVEFPELPGYDSSKLPVHIYLTNMDANFE